MVSITQTIKNIIIQFDINYKCFEEDYEKNLGGLEINDLRKELKIPETDHLKKNGTYPRDIYYLIGCCLKCSRIRIQKLQWTTTIDGEEEKIYKWFIEPTSTYIGQPSTLLISITPQRRPV